MATGPRTAPAPVTPERASELVTASVAGDTSAREELARSSLPRVRRTVLMAYGHGPDRDDLIQIAMARVFDRLESFRGEASFFTWVDRVTVNVVKDHFRRRRWAWLPLFEEEPAAVEVNTTPRPDQELERSELMDRLAEHFDRLSPKLRLPLVLHLVHGYSSAEVSVMLDLKFDTARKRILRGRKELIRRLGRDPRCREMLAERGR